MANSGSEKQHALWASALISLILFFFVLVFVLCVTGCCVSLRDFEELGVQRVSLV